MAALGSLAEAYARTDPSSALVKLRTLTEQIVAGVYRQAELPIPPQAKLNEMLRTREFCDLVPRSVRLKMDAVRDHGNKAAHGETITERTSIWILKESRDLAAWYYLSQIGGNAKDIPEFKEPPPGGVDGETKARLKEEKRAALEKLAAREAELQKLMAELALARSAPAPAGRAEDVDFAAYDSLEGPVVHYQRGRLPSRTIPLESIAADGLPPTSYPAAAAAQRAADVLKFDEASTRKWLIDSQLASVGWGVGLHGTSTESVGQEQEVLHQPTDTGKGFADYVLWDDNGKPLAVVEVKKTVESPEKGQTQARLYADGLEKMHGQRPVVFYTNGFEIWVWDDAQGYPPRKTFGFYSKDSLQYLVHQRAEKKPLGSVQTRPDIVGRLYQLEAIKRVTERFSSQRRKALIVQATGTGKTRVAIALTDLLIRSGWVKRVLFLCDRRELRKQAFNWFGDFIDEPMTRVSARTAKDRNKRLYFATYPAMMKIFQSFDVGFFDLIIADESHRSIYNVYGDLFRYFDCLQVGLTATPVEYVARNTYRLFECDTQNPTFYYPYDRAVSDGYLVPFEVITHQTEFLRRGIKYDQLTEEQRSQLEDQGEDPTLFDYDPQEVDKRIYNRDTARHIMRNLMENGIRDASGQKVGKTIVFARSHEHAVLLRQVFDELYPQYAGRFCQVIDNYDPRAEQLIDDFKEPTNELTIAISIDMLDTGIDVPEVVNLVFAKPVFSKVKFWQMIGRGTRLRPDLFGRGKDKQYFRIFDHWGNFDYFDFHYQHSEPSISKPLLQLVFEARLDLADAALRAARPETFDWAIRLIEGDLNSLPEETIAVREKWRQKRALSQPAVLRQFDAATIQALRQDMAPLMQWVNIRGYADAYDLDLLIARMQSELLRGAGRFQDYRITLMERINNLQMNLNPVREKAEVIRRARSEDFWTNLTPESLESLRNELRLIIHLRQTSGTIPVPTKVVDVADGGVTTARRVTSIPAVEMQAYRRQIEDALTGLFETDPVLKKIRRGEAVTEAELKSLTSLVLTQHPDVKLDILREFYGSAMPLDVIIRSIVGMEPDAVRERFQVFVQRHPSLTAKQTRFLSLLENHIARYGSIEVERLYEDPFTVVDADGIDGVFKERDADELIRIISSFSPARPQDDTKP